MKIRMRCIVGIAPIFVTLAIAISVLTLYLEHRETLWGLKTEASGLAIAISEFVDKERFVQLSTKKLDEKAHEEFFLPLTKILDAKMLLRCFAFISESKKMVFDIGKHSSNTASSLPANLIQNLQKDGIVIDCLESFEIMRCFAPISDLKGNIIGIIGIETSASRLSKQRQQSINRSIIGTFVFGLAGILCALIISFVLQRSMKSLSSAANMNNLGKYSERTGPRKGIIREFNELWNAFYTMTSILKGVVARTKRNILSVETFRTKDDLLKTFDDNFWQPIQLSHDNMAFMIKNVNNGLPGTFMDILKTEKHTFCAFGKNSSDVSDFESARKGSAIISYLRYCLVQDNIKNVLHSTVSLFPLEEFTFIHWKKISNELKVYEYDKGKNKFHLDTIKISEGFRKTFHNLGNEAEKRFDIYMATYDNSPPQKLMDELLQLISSIKPIPRGVLALICKEK